MYLHLAIGYTGCGQYLLPFWWLPWGKQPEDWSANGEGSLGCEVVSLRASIAVSDSAESRQLVGDIDNWFQYLDWVGFYLQSSN